MRKLVAAAFLALAFAAVIAPSASANPSPSTIGGTSSRLSLTAKITSFHATAAGVVADGVLTGTLSSGTSVSHDRAPVRFAAVAKSNARTCDVLTLHLAPLDLEPARRAGPDFDHQSEHQRPTRSRPRRPVLFARARESVVPTTARDLNSRLHAGHSRLWRRLTRCPRRQLRRSRRAARFSS
jgi:hypothetical protein